METQNPTNSENNPQQTQQIIDSEKKKQEALMTHRDFYTRGTTLLEEANESITSKHPNDQVLKHFSDAIEAFTKAINLQPDNNGYKTVRAQAYRQRGEYMQAQGLNPKLIAADFTAAVLQYPDDANNHYNIASITENDPSSITFKLESYNIAIGIQNDVAKYFNGRGDVYRFQNEPEKAADDYLHALSLDATCTTTKSKKQLFELFITLDESRQKTLYNDILFNRNTPISLRIWKPENFLISVAGFFEMDSKLKEYDFDFIKCSTDRGMLKLIREQYTKIDPAWLDPFLPTHDLSDRSEYTSLRPNSSGTVV